MLCQLYLPPILSEEVRLSYKYDSSANCIDVLSIPPTTTCEAIIEKIIDIVKAGKIKEISDIRDETGIDGLKVTIDLKRNVDPDILMQKLYKMTPLEDSFACNFNVLIAGVPRVLGVKELLEEWIAFRVECVRRRTAYDLDKKQAKLHLLKGLEKILLDIDKAIKIVRETAEETEVIPNLMIGFGIDETQAEYVAEIKLRHLNREYILKRTKEIEDLEKEISSLQAILASKVKVKNIIVAELKEVAKKYGKDRVTTLIDPEEIKDVEIVPEIPDYNVNLYFTKEGYFKKITPQSLRMKAEQKLKEGDIIYQSYETTNTADLLFFTNKCQVYKAKAADFPDTKASVLGEFVAVKLGMDEEEVPVSMLVTKNYEGFILFGYENGKLAKVPLNVYATKTNRKKLANAYSDKAPLADILFIEEDCDIVMTSTSGRMLLLHSGAIPLKTTRNTQGVAAMRLKKSKTLPTLGALPSGEEAESLQLKLDE